MFRFVHCADLHLTPPSASEKGADCFLTFQRIINFTNEQNAALLLIAGDLFDSIFAPQPLIQAVKKELARCHAKIFVCGGNHDYCGMFSPLSAGYSDNVCVIPSGGIHRYELPELNAVLYGTSFHAPHSSVSPLDGFEAENDGKLRIGLLHADAMHTDSAYAPVTVSQIDRSNLHYLALGHVHSHEILPCGSNTTASYPGTPQPRSFRETNGGINLITVQDGVCSLTHHELSVRKYLTVSAEISDCHTDSDCAKKILTRVLDSYEPECCHVKAILTGECSHFQPQLSVIERMLAGKFCSLSLEDDTLSVPDCSDSAFALSLPGLFLHHIDERIQNSADPEEKKRLMLARKYGLQAFYKEVNIHAD